MAASAINTNRTKVVGTGLTLKAAVDRDVLGLTPEAAKRVAAAQPRGRSSALWAVEPPQLRRAGPEQLSRRCSSWRSKRWLMSGDVFALVKRDAADRNAEPLFYAAAASWWRQTAFPRLPTSAEATPAAAVVEAVGRTSRMGKNTGAGQPRLSTAWRSTAAALRRSLLGAATPTRARSRPRSRPSGTRVAAVRRAAPACRTSCTSWTASARTSTAACRIWPRSLSRCCSCGATRNRS